MTVYNNSTEFPGLVACLPPGDLEVMAGWYFGALVLFVRKPLTDTQVHATISAIGAKPRVRTDNLRVGFREVFGLTPGAGRTWSLMSGPWLWPQAPLNPPGALLSCLVLCRPPSRGPVGKRVSLPLQPFVRWFRMGLRQGQADICSCRTCTWGLGYEKSAGRPLGPRASAPFNGWTPQTTHGEAPQTKSRPAPIYQLVARRVASRHRSEACSQMAVHHHRHSDQRDVPFLSSAKESTEKRTKGCEERLCPLAMQLFRGPRPR